MLYTNLAKSLEGKAAVLGLISLTDHCESIAEVGTMSGLVLMNCMSTNDQHAILQAQRPCRCFLMALACLHLHACRLTDRVMSAKGLLTCGIGVAALYILERPTAVNDEVFSPSTEMHKVQRAEEEGLDDKVSVTDSIHGVWAHSAIKAQLLSNELPVYPKGIASQCACKWTPTSPPAAPGMADTPPASEYILSPAGIACHHTACE